MQVKNFDVVQDSFCVCSLKQNMNQAEKLAHWYAIPWLLPVPSYEAHLDTDEQQQFEMETVSHSILQSWSLSSLAAHAEMF